MKLSILENPTPRKNDVGLRPHKAAMTKLSLLEAALNAIDVQPFSEINVAQLCATAGVSEPTFFKYFDRKDGLLDYYIDLWRIEAPCLALSHCAEASGRPFIDALFSVEADGIAQRPKMMIEIASWKNRQPGRATTHSVAYEERLIAFPDLPTAWKYDPLPLEQLLAHHLRIAKRQGQSNSELSIPALTHLLMAIFYGIPVALGEARADMTKSRYADSLNLFWNSMT